MVRTYCDKCGVEICYGEDEKVNDTAPVGSYTANVGIVKVFQDDEPPFKNSRYTGPVDLCKKCATALNVLVNDFMEKPIE